MLDNIFIIAVLVWLILAGVLILHWIGLGVMWVLDRRKGRKRLVVIRRVL